MSDEFPAPDGDGRPPAVAAQNAPPGAAGDGARPEVKSAPDARVRLNRVRVWIGSVYRRKAPPDEEKKEKREPLSLARVVTLLGLLATLGIGALLFLFVFRDASRSVVLLDRLEISDSLQKQGYSAEMLTRQMSDELTAIEMTAERQRVQEIESGTESVQSAPGARPQEQRAGQPASGDEKTRMVGQQGMRSFRLASDDQGANFEIPKTGLSRATLVGMIREVRGRPAPRVTGEVTHRGDSLRLTVRVVGGEVRSWTDTPGRLRDGLRKAAIHVMQQTRPITLARYYQAADPRKAYRAIMYCLQNEPQDDDAAAYDLLGQYYFERREIPRAVESFRRALRLDPEYGPARLNLAVGLLRQQKYAEAVRQIRRADRAENVSRAAVLNAWGFALEKLGDAAGAERKYHAALEADPADALVLLNLADLLVSRGEPRRAIPRYGEALQRNEALPGAHVGWGNALLAEGRYEAAIVQFDNALRISDDYAPAWRGLANAHRDRAGLAETFEEAMDHLRASLALYDSAAGRTPGAPTRMGNGARPCSGWERRTRHG